MRDPLLSRPLTHAERDHALSHLVEHIATDLPLAEIIDSMGADFDPSAPLRTDVAVEGISVLFPGRDTSAPPFSAGPDGVTLCHNLVKSAFYLLSGYDEWASERRDKWGRYPFEGSLMERLGAMRKPLVNYYFRWLAEAVARQCDIKGIGHSMQHWPARLHLSHDIDLVRYFTPRKTAYRWAQVLGLRHCDTSRKRLAKAAAISLLNILNVRHDDNPYWSFVTMEDNEAYLGYKSDWFFLPDDGGPFGPDYSLTDPDIAETMARLARRGNRVGVHAPINCQSAAEYAKHLGELRSACPDAKPRCRQHFLAIETQESYRAMAEAGIETDFTYGFSHHEGFRCGYCMPFRPFDHEAQRTLPITVVPLALMDTTVLTHKQMSYDDIYLAVGEMLDEVREFGGVFSLLWHNSTFDETYNPGIGKFYEGLHDFFSQYQLRDFEE